MLVQRRARIVRRPRVGASAATGGGEHTEADGSDRGREMLRWCVTPITHQKFDQRHVAICEGGAARAIANPFIDRVLMTLREFNDERRRHWMVWDVYPTLAERRRTNSGPPRGMPERRRRAESRARIIESMAHGWLAFEAEDGERRRLAPVPADPQWQTVSEEQLREWCARAEPTRRRERLIE